VRLRILRRVEEPLYGTLQNSTVSSVEGVPTLGEAIAGGAWEVGTKSPTRNVNKKERRTYAFNSVKNGLYNRGDETTGPPVDRTRRRIDKRVKTRRAEKTHLNPKDTEDNKRRTRQQTPGTQKGIHTKHKPDRDGVQRTQRDTRQYTTKEDHRKHKREQGLPKRKGATQINKYRKEGRIDSQSEKHRGRQEVKRQQRAIQKRP